MNRDALSKSAEIGRIVRQDIQEILDEKDKTSVLQLEPTYKSVLNQPERIAISSASAIAATQITSVVAESSFDSFVVNLPRPALNVKNLQLLSANIPQAQVCIPDDSLVFWYYRLATQNIRWNAWNSGTTYNPGDLVTYSTGDPLAFVGNYKCLQTNLNQSPPNATYWIEDADQKYESPNIFNLFCVRLLPSYYKQETLKEDAEFPYGFNQTFNSYEELQIQLKYMCESKDLALQSGASQTIIFPSAPYKDYMPSGFIDTGNDWVQDISITFDSKSNKFKFKGENVNTQFAIPDWDANTLYQPQSLVIYLGEVYYNITPEFSNPPESEDPPTSWNAYNALPTTVWNTYLVAGYNDPNVIKLQGTKTTLDWNQYHRFLPDSQSIYYKGNYWRAELANQNEPPPDGIWNATTLYSVGDLVYYDVDQFVYTCILAPGSIPPSNATYWTETYNPWIPYVGNPLYTGVNYISSIYDYTLQTGTESLLLGIPPQPYIDTALQITINNQTLNRRLGFTWSGQNMLIPFTEVINFKTGNLVTLFYNRLRPIPFYVIQQVFTSLSLSLLKSVPNLTADQQATYTADAFCNLVYSSVVNIYTRVLGGSTTDTVRNTNLLAIVPMQCGNLGVSLFNSYIDNPLTKIDTDIYTIEVQFRTESGQPYWFSNNAVITLQLKLGYE